MKPLERKGKGNGKPPLKGAERASGPSPGRFGNRNGVKKVADLRSAVESGRYRVEPKKVADKIVKDAVREIRNRLR